MRRPVRCTAVAAPIMLLVALSLGCVAQGGQFSATAGYGVGYYRPWGFNYGVWGPSYWVAPPRARVRVGAVHGRPPSRAFRHAPFGHPVPSIPRRRRWH